MDGSSWGMCPVVWTVDQKVHVVYGGSWEREQIYLRTEGKEARDVDVEQWEMDHCVVGGRERD